MTVRLVVRIDDAAMAANVGGAPQTTYRTFDIEHAELEALLIGKGPGSGSFSSRTLCGAELVGVTSHDQ